jgi:pimeloyl-ACP methyl ester carboxylesterase
MLSRAFAGSSSSRRHSRTDVSLYPVAVGVAVAAAALTVSALVNRVIAKNAERNNPPVGKFVEVGGVRLHYIERGQGEPLVLLHGNGSMIQDFSSSGLLDKAARKYRVIVFDRPGFGYSMRPRLTVWTPKAQADLICKALPQIGISRAIVFGHSWGASVAIALALQAPERVTRLILASGYFYPTVRSDVLASWQASPVLGDIISNTVSPFLARMMWPALMRKIFGPSIVPGKFAGFPKEMALRPSQLRASAAESALLTPAAFALHKDYAVLTMPVAIIAGKDDKLVDTEKQSARLHREIRHSTLRRVAGVGHMVHQSATEAVMAAIDQVQDAGLRRVPSDSGLALSETS